MGIAVVIAVVLRQSVPAYAAALIGVAGAGLVLGWQVLEWMRTTYWFDSDGDLRVDSGVLNRNERRLQLSRLQAVDVRQPVLARIFGMAEISVEVAGSHDSRVLVRFLAEAAAVDFRNQVLARAAGLRHDVGEAPEQVLVTVPTRSLLLAYLLSTRTVFLFALSATFIAVLFITEGAVGLFAALVTGGVPIFGLFGEILRWFDTTVAESPDGLRIRSGLLQRRSQTVPPGRVQAIAFEQSLLWVKLGWVRVRINVAGVRNDKEGGTNVLLPVAPWAVATAVVQRIMPGLAFEDFNWNPAPRRSFWRHPIQSRRLAIAHPAAGIATRSGVFVRRWEAIPHVRMQSVRITQGWYSRRLGLASVHIDSTPGPVHVIARSRPAETVSELAFVTADSARVGRATDAPLRWARAISQ
jgi:putative membrane protein